MTTKSRLSNFVFILLGAASVGLVVAVLALTGVLDRTERVVTAAPRPATATVAQTPAAAGSVADIYSKTQSAVAYVDAGQGSGSGFLIDGQGHVVTNDHVVEAGTSYKVRFGEDGSELSAKLIGKDPSTDLAVLQVDPSKVPAETKPLTLASSGELRPGDEAIAIGSPFGLSGTVTTGIISALDREIESPNGFPISGVLQTDAAINPGNSGGPLLDAEGRVIGVNSQIASSSRQSSGVGFAIAVDTVKQVVPQLIKGGDIQRAYLGVSSIAQPGESGAVVAAISPQGPAASTDLQPGDKITSIGDTQVKTPSDLSTAVLQSKPGEHVTLKVDRNGQQRTIDVTLGQRPDQIQQQPQG
jgi:S1-C subfamily serine protease